MCEFPIGFDSGWVGVLLWVPRGKMPIIPFLKNIGKKKKPQIQNEVPNWFGVGTGMKAIKQQAEEEAESRQSKREGRMKMYQGSSPLKRGVLDRVKQMQRDIDANK